MNESELIASIQNGDSDSFRKLYELYKNKAVRTAYLITGNRATAEDVAQEAFVKCCGSATVLMKSKSQTFNT